MNRFTIWLYHCTMINEKMFDACTNGEYSLYVFSTNLDVK